MPRTKRAIRRKNNAKQARKKRDIAKIGALTLSPDKEVPLHKFSKWLPIMHYGNHKTDNKFYGSKFDPSASYQRRIDRLNGDQNSYFEEG